MALKRVQKVSEGEWSAISGAGLLASNNLSDVDDAAAARSNLGIDAALSGLALTADTTVYFDSSMTAAQIQALIDAQPRNLGGRALTFQFADGTYALPSTLLFSRFFNGSLNIQGNTSEAGASTLHDTQSVVLDFSTHAGNSSCVYVSGMVDGWVTVRNLKIKCPDVTSTYCLNFTDCQDGRSYYNSFLCATKVNATYGVGYYCAQGRVDLCYFSSLNSGVLSNTGSVVWVNGCDDTGVAPTYGVNAYSGIINRNGTTITGTTADVLQNAGGKVFPDTLTADTTVNLTSSMTAAQIQKLINDQPRDLNNYTLTFQFADGTYTLSTSLNFAGFRNGTININGNRTEANNSVLHTTQAVIFDCASHGISTVNCYCPINVYNIKFLVPDVANIYGITANTTNYVAVFYCYVLGDGQTAANYGFGCTRGVMYVNATYISNVRYGMLSNVGASVYSNGNDDTGTLPQFGNYASGGYIHENGIQVAGSTAFRTTSSLGGLFTPNGDDSISVSLSL